MRRCPGRQSLRVGAWLLAVMVAGGGGWTLVYLTGQLQSPRAVTAVNLVSPPALPALSWQDSAPLIPAPVAIPGLLANQEAEQACFRAEETARHEAKYQEAARLEEQRRAVHCATLKPESKEAAARSSEPAPTTDPPDPDHLITQLSHVYAKGDLGGLISLFTPDAKVTKGQGSAYNSHRLRPIFCQDLPSATRSSQIALEDHQGWSPVGQR